jgi:hypothetical protein
VGTSAVMIEGSGGMIQSVQENAGVVLPPKYFSYSSVPSAILQINAT